LSRNSVVHTITFPTFTAPHIINTTTIMGIQNNKVYKLSNGVEMPAVGFGTFANEGSKGETYKAVTKALEVGYRHLDCAWFYQNEGEVGDAVADFLKANPSVTRKDLFICTKVWNHLHEPEEVSWSFHNSLEKLKMDYIDLFLVHWPIAAEKNEQNMPKIGSDGKYIIKKDLTENPEPTWRAMEELYKSGKAHAIGVSNWTVSGLQQLLKIAEVKPHVNQIEIHPFLPSRFPEPGPQHRRDRSPEQDPQRGCAAQRPRPRPGAPRVGPAARIRCAAQELDREPHREQLADSHTQQGGL
jgi:diketogulonate reductase-like aldo/keto reductase